MQICRARYDMTLQCNPNQKSMVSCPNVCVSKARQRGLAGDGIRCRSKLTLEVAAPAGAGIVSLSWRRNSAAGAAVLFRSWQPPSRHWLPPSRTAAISPLQLPKARANWRQSAVLPGRISTDCGGIWHAIGGGCYRARPSQGPGKLLRRREEGLDCRKGCSRFAELPLCRALIKKDLAASSRPRHSRGLCLHETARRVGSNE